ncbi:MAG: DNA primase, partial [Erysipelotrichaceae bacterium]|nr:DNA primase [Erysipelotrichaceae bacterium]
MWEVSGSVNIVDEIKSRCNIVDVIGRVVTLKKAGANYKGLCPFHNEKTPSFIVSETKQIFKCFGCGESGDVITFVEKYYNLDFKGAAEMLARDYGIDLTGAFANQGNKKELYNINREAARYFFKALRAKDNPGYRYMAGRGITNDTLREFGIGYADDNWTSLTDYLTGKGFDPKTLYELGLVSRSDKGRYYDKFRNRVIFPIINTAGEIIGFGGRVIDKGEPKYLNSSESKAFQKKNNLYGINLAKNYIAKDDCIVLVEGYMDVISLYQAGIKNVAASLGTALTPNQASLIKRYTKNVILSYDADNAGQLAADRGLDILYNEGLKAKVLKVPEGKD